jgi:hypothetical protein
MGNISNGMQLQEAFLHAVGVGPLLKPAACHQSMSPWEPLSSKPNGT